MPLVVGFAGLRNCQVELRSSHQSRDQGDDEEDDEHPEQKPGGLHGEAGNAAEADGCRDQRDDQEHERIVKKVSHFTPDGSSTHALLDRA